MTITRRLGIGYAVMAFVCLLVVTWLWYHEFVDEPAEYAARGLGDLHKETAAELVTVVFLALIPVLLGLGWWWTRRVLAPLRALTEVAQNVETHNLRLSLPQSRRHDEVDTLAGVLTAMTARLDASFQQIREFTLHASHELKTPLTVMRAQLETVRREERTLTPAQADWIEGLLDEVQRLANIVDSLTLLTKADAGLVTLAREPVELGELVEEAGENAVMLARAQPLAVRVEECAALTVTGDRHRLRQLLLILVDNAVKYNRPGGSIRMALRRRDGEAEFRITNDGGGISPETQRRLFGRFVRGENAAGRVEGCGLGLNIAQWIVRAHQGSIRIFGENGDQTTVELRLPLRSGE